MTGKMETAFYHDETPTLPNYGQMSDYERYHGHKVENKKGMVSQLSHIFPDTMASTSGLKLLQGQPGIGSNINPNSIGINNIANGSILASSDVNLLKLSSPDLEQLIIQSNQGLVTTSPGPSCTGSPFVFRSQETSDQEGFADGFVKALADLHKQNQLISGPISPPSSVQGPYQRNIIAPGEMPIYTNMSGYNTSQIAVSASYPGNQLPYTPSSHTPGHSSQGQGVHSHSRGLDASQIVPEMPHPPGESAASPPSLSPIDLETQERIKAERKKLRNRIAASKCRKRKLERISRLEEKVKVLKTQNSDLAAAASVLREQVAQLKDRVMGHVTSGCQIAVGPSSVAKRGESSSC